jgi:hypothetical protein
MERWEYCYIAIQIQGARGNIIWPQPDRLRVEELVLDKRAGDDNAWDMAHRAMARLGTEGWEMTGLLTDGTTARWYFKRALQEGLGG